MIEVVVLDAHPIIRSGIQLLLSKHSNMHFAGGTASIRDASELLQSMHPSVIMVNLPLPVSSGFEQLHQLRKAYPTVGIIVLSALEEFVYAESCFRAGANAFVSKRASLDNIVTAIERAARGEMYCSEELKAHLVKRAATQLPTTGTNPTEVLSHAESQVFEMMGEGMTNRQIAERLEVSIKTVETYRTRMKQKLGFRDGIQLTHFAIMQTLGQKVSKAIAVGTQEERPHSEQEKER